MVHKEIKIASAELHLKRWLYEPQKHGDFVFSSTVVSDFDFGNPEKGASGALSAFPVL